MSAPGFVVGPIWSHNKRGGIILAGEREYRGARFLDVRFWVNDGTTPTGKGIGIPLDQVEALARALLAYSQGISKG